MYGEITAEQRDHFVIYFLAIIQKQTRRAFHHLVGLTERLPGADEAAYYRRFEALANGFFRSTISQTSLTQVYLQIILAGARYGFVFPADLLLHAKAVTTAEALMLTLAPDLKFEEEARPSVIRHYVERAMDVSRIKSLLEQTLPELLLFGELPPAHTRDAAGSELSDRLWREVALAMAQHAHLWELSVDVLPMAMKPLIQETLKGRHTPREIDAIVEATKERYRSLRPGLPAQETVGGDLMVHLAAFTLAMYRSFQACGYSAEAATSVVYDTAWRAYTRMGDVAWLLSGKLGRDGYPRLEFCLDAFLTFPFSSPAYRWEHVDVGPEVYAFDMVRCPVADYFRSQGMGELCVNTWCNLDFPLARQWNGELERAETLAGGGPRCDFRWRIRQPSSTELTARSGTACDLTRSRPPFFSVTKTVHNGLQGAPRADGGGT
jgi:ubiquinone biosynthesis protein